jgi:hypothetical protein
MSIGIDFSQFSRADRHLEELEMSFTSDLLDTPANLSRASKWTAMNGYIYLSLGALFMIWPGAVQTLFRDEPFVGREEGLFRILGMTVAVIGWLYLFGGRSGGRQIIPASVLDRWILVPAVGVSVALSGVFPHAVLAFVLLDALLALGALLLRTNHSQPADGIKV